MKPRQYHLRIQTFSYGGNGACASTNPDVHRWVIKNLAEIIKDPRIASLSDEDLCDTPITMTRNRAVLDARKAGADLLLMIDSDQKPDMYLGKDPLAQPFWKSSFDFLDAHYEKGPVVIGAPYCGPPPHENVYVFKWENRESEHPNDDYQIVGYSRSEASYLSGIQEAAALPTGMILYDMRAFEITEPKELGDKPWFYYEFNDLYESQKVSTEDVTATRDMSIMGIQKLGYNPIFCNWDAWIGHWKPKCVGKPMTISADGVAQKMKNSILNGQDGDSRIIELNLESDFDHGTYHPELPCEIAG